MTSHIVLEKPTREREREVDLCLCYFMLHVFLLCMIFLKRSLLEIDLWYEYKWLVDLVYLDQENKFYQEEFPLEEDHFLLLLIKYQHSIHISILKCPSIGPQEHQYLIFLHVTIEVLTHLDDPKQSNEIKYFLQVN